uniref:Uncharacterized protein n=1 Tax=Vitis vinifera TaxID=29760 RepID=F6HXJ3_VITVI
MKLEVSKYLKFPKIFYCYDSTLILVFNQRRRFGKVESLGGEVEQDHWEGEAGELWRRFKRFFWESRVGK